MKISGAIFDLDGTLLDSMHVWDGLNKAYLESRGLEYSPEIDSAIQTMSLDDAAEFYKTTFNLDDSKEEIIASVLSFVSQKYQNEIMAKDGVKPFLDFLKSRGVKMAVATANDVSMVEASLANNGILEYFDFILTCSMVGAGKEKPDIYLEALKRLNTPKDETVVFEDALYAAKTACDAGFKVIGVYDESAKSDEQEMKKLSVIYADDFNELMNKI